MSDPYSEFITGLEDDLTPFRTMSVQFFFIAWLLLGQVLALAGWKVLHKTARFFRRQPLQDVRGGWNGPIFAVYLLAAQVVLLLGWRGLVAACLAARSAHLADIIVTVHLSFVLLVLLSLVLVLVGAPLGWGWTRNFWFRLAHLLVIEIVAGQAIVNIECPLTTWERELRGGDLRNYEDASAIGQFCNGLLFYPLSIQTFAIIYGAFGLLVLLSWVLVPPKLQEADYPSRDPPPAQEATHLAAHSSTSRQIRSNSR